MQLDPPTLPVQFQFSDISVKYISEIGRGGRFYYHLIKTSLGDKRVFPLRGFLSQILPENVPILQDLREYSVSELHSVDAEVTELKVEDPQSNSTNTCNYHSKGGFGHATMGVR